MQQALHQKRVTTSIAAAADQVMARYMDEYEAVMPMSESFELIMSRSLIARTVPMAEAMPRARKENFIDC